MIDALKPLVVVFFLALIMFAIARPVCLNFMEADDFDRRRKVWLALTCLEFIIPDFFAFALIALPLIYWATSKDRHPTALYLLLLLAVPPMSLALPLPLVNKLFDLSPYRILAFALLIPTAVRLRRLGASKAPGLAKVDLLVLAYGALGLVLFMPYESLTNTARRGVIFLVDIYVLYYVFSRATLSRPAMRDTLASLCLVCAVLTPIAIFEAAKGWLLYFEVPARWGVPNPFAWLFRDSALRAQASAGHSLTMGYLFAIALGFWLYCGNWMRSTRVLWAGGALLFCGVMATASRAPMLVAAAVIAFYMVLSPAGRRGLFGTLVAFGAAAVPFSMTPVGQRIVNSLPFIGTSEQSNVEYRQQLAEVSWRLIKQNPWFGDPFSLNYMEELRQGEGIIDLVNTFAGVALFNGLVGCAIFTICFVYPLWRAFRATQAARSVDADDTEIGAALVSCMLGTLLMMATASFGTGFEIVAWALAGMCGAYPALVRANVPRFVENSPEPTLRPAARRHRAPEQPAL